MKIWRSGVSPTSLTHIKPTHPLTLPETYVSFGGEERQSRARRRLEPKFVEFESRAPGKAPSGRDLKI